MLYKNFHAQLRFKMATKMANILSLTPPLPMEKESWKGLLLQIYPNCGHTLQNSAKPLAAGKCTSTNLENY